MKNFVKSLMVLGLFTAALSFTACGGDDEVCYDCTGSTPEEAFSFCSGDDIGGVTLTVEQANALAESSTTSGLTCEKK